MFESKRGRDDRDVLFSSRFVLIVRRMPALRAAVVEARDEARIEPAFDKFFVPDHLTEERQRGLNPANGIFVERASQSIDGFSASPPPRRKF